MPPSVMSIFGVEPRRIGGVETFARELSEQLDRFGRRSVLCFLSAPGAPVRRFLDLPNVTLETLPNISRPSRDVLAGMARLVRKHRPDIVHLYFVGFLSPYPWLVRLCGVPRIYFTDQGSQPEGYVAVRAAWWKRAIGRTITWPLEQVLCISDYNVRCALTRGYIAPDRVSRMYNSVDLRRDNGNGVAFRRRYSIPEGRRVVLQVSWIIPAKGIGDLVEAAPLVLARDPDVHFVLVGEGPHRASYMERVQQMGLESHFTWTGLMEDPVAEGVYSAADVVCQLSRWEEAFGWVIAEAMACHRPIVATRVGGIPELVEDGRSGFLVPPGNPAEVADKIVALLGDPDLRRRMGDLGRMMVELRFLLERNVAELVKMYGLPPSPERSAAAAH